MSLGSYEDRVWRDFNGPLWAAIEDIARFCGEITLRHLAMRRAA